MLEELLKLGLKREHLMKSLDYMSARKEVESKEVHAKRKAPDKPPGRWVYIKAIFNQTFTKKEGKETVKVTCRTTGSTILSEVFVARDKEEGNKFMTKFPKKIKKLIIGNDGLKAHMEHLVTYMGYDEPGSPVVGLRTFRKKGYKPIRRVMYTGGIPGAYEPV